MSLLTLQQNCPCHRHNHQPTEVQQRRGREEEAVLHLRRHRSEAIYRRSDCEAFDGLRIHKVHYHRVRYCLGRCAPTIPSSLLRLCHGRVLP